MIDYGRRAIISRGVLMIMVLVVSACGSTSAAGTTTSPAALATSAPYSPILKLISLELEVTDKVEVDELLTVRLKIRNISDEQIKLNLPNPDFAFHVLTPDLTQLLMSGPQEGWVFGSGNNLLLEPGQEHTFTLSTEPVTDSGQHLEQGFYQMRADFAFRLPDSSLTRPGSIPVFQSESEVFEVAG